MEDSEDLAENWPAEVHLENGDWANNQVCFMDFVQQ